MSDCIDSDNLLRVVHSIENAIVTDAQPPARVLASQHPDVAALLFRQDAECFQYARRYRSV